MKRPFVFLIGLALAMQAYPATIINGINHYAISFNGPMSGVLRL